MTPNPDTFSDEELEAMCRAHDAEDAAQKGEPSPWDLPVETAEDHAALMIFRCERLAAMRCAVDAIYTAATRDFASQLSTKKAEIERLRKALEPFAEQYRLAGGDLTTVERLAACRANVFTDDFRRAAEALRPSRPHAGDEP
jgi:hypothetical protein